MATLVSFAGDFAFLRQGANLLDKSENKMDDNPEDIEEDDREADTKVFEQSNLPRREEAESDCDIQHSFSDIILRREATYYSYHDSDSDLPDYGLGSGSPIPGVDLDKSDADSWDWTFHDENISDLEIKAAHEPTKTVEVLTDISEDPVSETLEESLESEHSEQQKDISIPTKIVHETLEFTEETKNKTDYKSVLLKKDKSELFSTTLKGKYDDAAVKFIMQPSIVCHESDKTTISVDSSEHDDVVYFESSLSSQVTKSRLKYLQVNSSVVNKTSRRSIQVVKGSKPSIQKRQGLFLAESPKSVMEFQNSNLRNKATKFDTAEAKFMFSSRPDVNNISKNPRMHMPQTVVASSTFLSFSKSEHLPLPPITDKRVDLLSRKEHSMNDALSEKLINWRLNRSREMSRSELFVKSQMKAVVQAEKVNHPYLQSHTKWTGFERFRHFARMILILFKAVGRRREKPEESNYNFLSWTVVYDEVLGISRLNYNSGALTFDPLLYKANKESTLSQETKDILRLPSDQRTDAQIHSVMVSFQNVIPSFSEFPKGIQQSMIKVCTYEKFEAGRVIIRQGHRAENFYFIISGCAVVTQMDSGEDHVHTTNVLGKGNSFGELAFLHMSKRSATVTCRDDVELICIERDDFIDIFMRPHQGEEPGHITFLKSIDLLKGWPIALLPHANPKICAFTYVRRGVILCQNSARNDWIFVVYSGSCKVLKALNDGPIIKHTDRTKSPETLKVTLAPTSSSFSKIYTTSASSQNIKLEKLQQERQKTRVRKQGIAAPVLRSVQNSEASITETDTQDMSISPVEPLSLSQLEHLTEINDIFYKKHVLPTIIPHSQTEEDTNTRRTQRKVSLHAPQPPAANSMFKPKRQSYGLQAPALPPLAAQSMDAPNKQQPPLTKTTFIEVLRLEPGDIFGLEHVVLSGIRDVASYSLVSEGAEVVLISKMYFRKHLSEDTMKRIRQLIRPLPSEKALQKKFEAKKLWEAYKAQTMARHTQGSRRLCSKLQT